MAKKLILASSSPRRKELLQQIGLKFIVDSINGEESLDTDLEPHEQVKKMSAAKANFVASRYPDSLILAADTIGVLDGKILGKPLNPEAAKEMLQAMSGRPHKVITGYTVLDTASKNSISNTVETLVYIKHLSVQEIDNYVTTGEPLDKAGAYGIQGKGALIVERIEGDYFNVVGLPLFALAESLKEFGIDVL